MLEINNNSHPSLILVLVEMGVVEDRVARELSMLPKHCSLSIRISSKMCLGMHQLLLVDSCLRPRHNQREMEVTILVGMVVLKVYPSSRGNNLR